MMTCCVCVRSLCCSCVAPWPPRHVYGDGVLCLWDAGDAGQRSREEISSISSSRVRRSNTSRQINTHSSENQWLRDAHLRLSGCKITIMSIFSIFILVFMSHRRCVTQFILVWDQYDFKGVFFCSSGCIYSIKNTEKSVILWNIIAISNIGFLF